MTPSRAVPAPPFTFAKKGAFKDMRPDDLAAVAISSLIKRSVPD